MAGRFLVRGIASGALFSSVKILYISVQSKAPHIKIRPAGNYYILSCVPKIIDWKPFFQMYSNLQILKCRGRSSKPKCIRSSLFETRDSVAIFIIEYLTL